MPSTLALPSLIWPATEIAKAPLCSRAVKPLLLRVTVNACCAAPGGAPGRPPGNSLFGSRNGEFGSKPGNLLGSKPGGRSFFGSKPGGRNFFGSKPGGKF